jgi:predicted NACHT family NTPase
MLPNADECLRQMKRQIDQLLAEDEKLQRFLTWVDEKARSVDAPGKPAAIRAFYFDLNRDFDLGFSRILNHALNRDLDGDRALDRALNRDLDGDLDGDRALDRALDHALDRALDISFARALDISFARALEAAGRSNPGLKLKLDILYSQLPNSRNEWRFRKQWWQEEGQAWTNQLRAVIIEHRNIGHDWQFSAAQKKRSRQYYDANKLLVDCLNSDCYISRRVREEIEATLLLPIAEIKHQLKMLHLQNPPEN